MSVTQRDRERDTHIQKENDNTTSQRKKKDNENLMIVHRNIHTLLHRTRAVEITGNEFSIDSRLCFVSVYSLCCAAELS